MVGTRHSSVSVSFSSGWLRAQLSGPSVFRMASNSKSSAEKTIGSSEKATCTGDTVSTASVDNEEKFTPFFGKLCPFSQHYLCHFTIDGISYNCAEQYMMHQKAVVFKDLEMAKQILASKNPVEQRRFGRKVKNFDPVVWNKKCENIVREANFEKFAQNAELKEQLLATRGTTLVEASPRNRKWGIGLGVKNPKAHCRKQWRGQNLLGEILTSVRDDLNEESS